MRTPFYFYIFRAEHKPSKYFRKVICNCSPALGGVALNNNNNTRSTSNKPPLQSPYCLQSFIDIFHIFNINITSTINKIKSFNMSLKQPPSSLSNEYVQDCFDKLKVNYPNITDGDIYNVMNKHQDHSQRSNFYYSSHYKIGPTRIAY